MKNKKLRVGKYILDTLSIGMYNHPLMLIREYIQNSTDAIDKISEIKKTNKKKAKIEIKIDPIKNSLTIKDNGCGIQSDKAWSTLHDIGKSEKSIMHNRGFRGIGRLGGLGYCDLLKFITKAEGENIYSESTWNCAKLRKLIKEDNDLETADIIKEISEFKQYEYSKGQNKHFFVLEMHNLQSSRDILFNVPEIKSYLAQVAPVPFNKNSFNSAIRIDKDLRVKVPNYETYEIYVNNEQILKPYNDRIILRGKAKDEIDDINFIELHNRSNILAFCWLAKLNLLGSVSSTSLVDGIRVRKGNILIGDKNLLSEFFREKRFNNYLVGEIHIIEKQLIPNSRRDDFEDTELRDEFYDIFIKKIGLPYSRMIRRLSLLRSLEKNKDIESCIENRIFDISENGYLSIGHKELILEELEKWKKTKNISSNDFVDKLIYEVKKSKHILDNNNIELEKKELLKSLFEIIYNECSNKKDAENVIRIIINRETNNSL